MKKFLIVLFGQGDLDIKLTSPAAQKWIEKDWGDRTEKIPKAVLKDYPVDPEETKVYVTSGSGDNDRALACPGDSFGSFIEVTAYIHAHNIKLTGEFVGCLY